MHTTPPGSKSPRYTREFRAYAVAAVREGRSATTAAADLGIDHWTIARWLKAARKGAPPGAASAGEPKRPGPKPTSPEELRKVELFKAPHARKWSARLRFSDGSKTSMETNHTEDRKANMQAVQAWMRIARAKGILAPRRDPRTAAAAAEELAPKAFGLDKPRGHALVARPPKAHPRTRAAPADSHKKTERILALVDVLAVLERLDPAEAVWVMRAAAGVTDVNLREQQLVPPGRNGHTHDVSEWIGRGTEQ